MKTTETFKVLRTKFVGDTMAYSVFYGTTGAVTSFFIAAEVSVPMMPFIKYYVTSTIVWNIINWMTGGIYGRFLDKWRSLWKSLWKRTSKKSTRN